DGLPLTGRFDVSGGRANHRVGDLVQIWRRHSAGIARQCGCRASPARIAFAKGLLTGGPPAPDDVAREQALLFAPLSVLDGRIDLAGRSLLGSLWRGRSRPRRIREALLTRTLVEGAQAFLVLAQPIWTERSGRR